MTSGPSHVRHVAVVSSDRMAEQSTVLVVADKKADWQGLVAALKRDARYKIVGPVPAVDGLRICAQALPMAVVVHVDLQDISAAEFCLLVRRRANGTPYTSLLFGPARHHPGAAAAGSAVDGYLSASQFEGAAGEIETLIREATDKREQLVDHYRGRHLDAHFDRVKVLVDGRPVDLTRRELGLLRFLVTHPNRILSRSDILAHVWRNENDGRSRTVDVHVRRLRIKLSSAGQQIETATGVGYRFSEK